MGPSMSETNGNRRDFLRSTTAAAASLPLASAANNREEVSNDENQNPLFQPQEFWEDRIQPPDDGKRLGWFVDTRRCFGCHGCEVSCKSENDVPLGNYIRQTIYKDTGEHPQVARLFLPMSCQHCEEAPCLKACPCGALHKEAGGTVAIDYNTCCGHGTCVEVCPYGAIYLDPVAKQAVKCHNCYHRTEQGMEPACVPTCPSQALYFGDLNDPQSSVSKAIADAEQTADGVTQLRADKGTKPRMWFTGKAAVEVEERVPRESESYSPEAYDIYNWGDKQDR